MKSHIAFAILAMICINLQTQARKKSPAENWAAHCPDTNKLKRIDKDKLLHLCRSNSRKVTLACIFTNYCSGTKFLLQDVKDLRRAYGDSLQIVLCSSAPYREMPDLLRILREHGLSETPVYVIDEERYPERKQDDRIKGKRFRDDVCHSCRRDIIGVPYTILFDANGRVIIGGYLSDEVIQALVESKIRS